MKKVLLLNRNEIIQGPSSEVLKSLKKFSKNKISFYYDGYYESELATKLAKIYQHPREGIIIGYGLEDILRTIFDSLNSQDVVLTQEFHFTYYTKYLDSINVKVSTFKLIEGDSEFRFDIGDCIKKIKQIRPKIILITSPNNPTGNSITPNELELIMNATSKQSIIVLDEAYFGFDLNYKQQDFLNIVRKYKNLIILRTFSKLFALAGARIAYAICGANVKKLLRYQDYYLGGSRILESMAISALESKTYYKELSNEIIAIRDSLITNINNLKNFKAFKSNGNFILVKINKNCINKFKAHLSKGDVFIWKFVSEDCIRVTINNKLYTNNFFQNLKKLDKININEPV